MRKNSITVLITLFVALSVVSCKEKTIEELESEISTITTTSTVAEITTFIEITSEIIETTEELVMEEVYESEDFPEVHISMDGYSHLNVSVNVDDESFEFEEELNQSWFAYSVDRVDRKVISIEFFCSSSTEEEAEGIGDSYIETIVLSTSGDIINISDLLYNEEGFINYLQNNGVNEVPNDINDYSWVLTINGLLIFDTSDGVLHIPYTDLEGIMNSNYFPDNGPMYGDFVLYDSVLRYGGHSLYVDPWNSYYHDLYIDGEEFDRFENEEGEILPSYEARIFFNSDDRCFVWAYWTEYDPDENGNPSILIDKCAMLVELTNGYPEVVATIHDGPDEYESIYDIPEDILELMNFSEW